MDRLKTQPHPTTKEHRDAVLQRLAELWDDCPHLRLGQMLCNMLAVEQMLPYETITDYQARRLRHLHSVADQTLVGLE